MKAIHIFNIYLITLFQSGFAGVLLAQVVNFYFYRQPGPVVSLVSLGVAAMVPALLYLFKKKGSLYTFKHFNFGWIFFSSAILYSIILLFLLVSVSLKFGDGFIVISVLQFSSLLALAFVLAEHYLLQQALLQKVPSALLQVRKPAFAENLFISLFFLLSSAAVCVFWYERSGTDFLEIIWVSLFCGSGWFLLLLLVKVLNYRKLRSLPPYKADTPAPGEKKAPHFSFIRRSFFYLEKNLEAVLLDTAAEERPVIYGKIRQIPLIDKIPELEDIQRKHLQDDPNLAWTLRFLKKKRDEVPVKGSRYDVDSIQDIMEIKAFIRSEIQEQNALLVQKLLNDSRPEVKKAAIFASVHFSEPGFVPVLVNLLKEHEFAFSAGEALFEMGDQCIPFLRSAKYRNKENSFFIEQCLNLVGSYKSIEARDFLVEMLNEPRKSLQYKAAAALLRNEYTLSSLHKTQILHFIESLIATIAVQREIRLHTDEKNPQIKEALFEEETEKKALVVELLKAFLPPAVHRLLQQSAEGKGIGNRYALLAFIDLFFPLILRKKCKMLLGSEPDENIAPALQAEYLNEQIHFRYKNSGEAGRQVLRIDYSQIGIWLRHCSLKQLVQVPDKEISRQILAEVFNRNQLLQETACEVLYDLNYDYYYLYMQRLDPERAKALKHKIEMFKTVGHQDQQFESHLLYHQVLFLKAVPLLRNCSYESLARHIQLFSRITIEEGKKELEFDPYKPNGYWIIFQGEISIYYRGETLVRAGKGDVVDMSFLTEAEKNTVTIHSKNLLQIYFVEYSTLNNLYLTSGSFQNNLLQPCIEQTVPSVVY